MENENKLSNKFIDGLKKSYHVYDDGFIDTNRKNFENGDGEFTKNIYPNHGNFKKYENLKDAYYDASSRERGGEIYSGGKKIKSYKSYEPQNSRDLFSNTDNQRLIDIKNDRYSKKTHDMLKQNNLLDTKYGDADAAVKYPWHKEWRYKNELNELGRNVFAPRIEYFRRLKQVNPDLAKQIEDKLEELAFVEKEERKGGYMGDYNDDIFRLREDLKMLNKLGDDLLTENVTPQNDTLEKRKAAIELYNLEQNRIDSEESARRKKELLNILNINSK